MFVTPEIDCITKLPFPDTFEGDRYAECAAFLDAYCELNEISVCEDPDYKRWDVMLARVRPVGDDFWSMRVTDPANTPGMRMLGGFCAKDEFVALVWEFREDIDKFDDLVKELKATWHDYFGGLPPLSGNSLDDYLSRYDTQ